MRNRHNPLRTAALAYHLTGIGLMCGACITAKTGPNRLLLQYLFAGMGLTCGARAIVRTGAKLG
jgi:hypothetical protein